MAQSEIEKAFAKGKEIGKFEERVNTLRVDVDEIFPRLRKLEEKPNGLPRQVSIKKASVVSGFLIGLIQLIIELLKKI